MSPSRPTVSIVIPTYQSAPYVHEAIDTALAQDEAAHEVVVVDDGSTDETPEILARYGDDVVVVTHPENRGVAAARNTGVRTSTGDAVLMLDADDRALPHRLRVSLDHLVGGGDRIGCVMGMQHTFCHDGAEVPLWALDVDGSPIRFANSQILVWRHALEELGGYDERFRVGEDSDLLVRLRESGREVLMVDVVVNERRIHDRNISAKYGAEGRPAYLSTIRGLLQRRRDQ